MIDEVSSLTIPHGIVNYSKAGVGCKHLSKTYSLFFFVFRLSLGQVSRVNMKHLFEINSLNSLQYSCRTSKSLLSTLTCSQLKNAKQINYSLFVETIISSC